MGSNLTTESNDGAHSFELDSAEYKFCDKFLSIQFEKGSKVKPKPEAKIETENESKSGTTETLLKSDKVETDKGIETETETKTETVTNIQTGVESKPSGGADLKFRRKFENSLNGRINWDFWTEEKSYESAYRKALKSIKNLNKEDGKYLYVLARQVVKHRGSEIDRRMGVASEAQLDAYKSWIKIEKKLLEKLQEPDADLWFVIGVLLSTAVFASYGLFQFIQTVNEVDARSQT